MSQPRPLDLTTLPEGLAVLLRWAHTEERAASGARRRPAQRFTREILGGASAAGYPAWLLGECLGVTAGTIRNRAQQGGWLAATKVQQGVGVDRTIIQHWRDNGLLHDERIAANNELFYPAAEIIRALGDLARPEP